MINRDSIHETLEVVVNLYREHGEAHIYTIHGKMRMKGHNSWEIKKMMSIIRKEGWIEPFGMVTFKPTDRGMDEYRKYRPRGKVRMTPKLVKDAIENFKEDKSSLPDITDIVNQFEKDFGIPEQEDPKRYIRQLAIDGIIKRTGNSSHPKYYTDNNTSKLGGFL